MKLLTAYRSRSALMIFAMFAVALLLGTTAFSVQEAAYAQSEDQLTAAQSAELRPQGSLSSQDSQGLQNLQNQQSQQNAQGLQGAATSSATQKLLRTMSTKSLDGIDISSWQEGIDLNQVDADFVIIKATGGTSYTNPYYKKWAKQALASGKKIGFYHYARETSCPGSAVKEAKHFIKKVKPFLGRAVLFLDFEADALNMKYATKWAKVFMDTVYKNTRVKPLIYLSQSATHALDWSKVAKKYKLWVAQYLYKNFNTGYLGNPDGGTSLGFWRSAKVYQYSSTGQVDGYSGSLDLNKFYGSKAAWMKLARKVKVK